MSKVQAAATAVIKMQCRQRLLPMGLRQEQGMCSLATSLGCITEGGPILLSDRNVVSCCHPLLEHSPGGLGISSPLLTARTTVGP